MSAVYNGGVTVAGEIPPVAAALATLANALADANVLLAQLVDLIRAARAAIRAPAVTGLEAQLSAAASLEANLALQLGDPAAYVAGILTAIDGVIVAVETLPPLPAIEAQLDASLSVAAGIRIQIGLIDLGLAQLDAIIDQILALIQALTVALASYAALAASLAQAGCHSLAYTGPLGSMGSALDSVTFETGISAGQNVLAVVLLASDAEPAAQAAVRATFRVVP